MDQPARNNPNWIRDEEILLVDLYKTFRGSLPDQDHPKVIELSALLTTMPWHPKSSRAATFRNPAGVAMKLRNLRTVETGIGKRNVAQIDRQILNEFLDRPVELSEMAASIRKGIELAESLHINEDELIEEFEFTEGRLLTAIHVRRERNPLLRKELLRRRKKENNCLCEICEASFGAISSFYRAAAFEVHHRVPLSINNLCRRTTIRDVSLLCAVCHRLIHSLIARERQWIDVADARTILMGRSDVLRNPRVTII
jgi:5-methylcytosine-specific restriction protein A